MLKKVKNTPSITILSLLTAFLILQNSSKVVAKNLENNQAISIFSLNILYNNLVINQNSKIQCELEFYDDYKQKTSQKLDKISNYIILYSNPGKVYLDNIKCYNHSIPLIYGKSRLKRIDDWGFVAYKGFLNYAGEINIKYYTSNFKILDLLNLAGLVNSEADTVEISVNDKILDNLNYVNSRFRDVYQLRIAKSLLQDIQKLKPNDNPETYSSDKAQEAKEELSAKTANQEQLKNNIELKKQFSKDQSPKEQNAQDRAQDRAQDNSQDRAQETIKFDEKINNDSESRNLAPKHPYLAPIYSEFYAPNYNPYLSVGLPIDPYNFNYNDVQDPVIEHRQSQF